MRLSEERLAEIVGELSIKPGHDKVKAGIQDLLVDGLGADRRQISFELTVLEAQGRIDAILGRTAFEVKRDLVRELGDAEEQLSRYLPEREKATRSRFIGIATDGLDWRAYEWRGGALALLRTFRVEAARPERLLAWLDGAAAIRAELPTDALTLTNELGPESVAFRRAEADLRELWAKLGNKASVVLKRRLWQQLLRLVYGRDIENEALWLQHTYLVIVAKAIAARVLDFDIENPADLLSGRPFVALGVGGAVEGDFFDWVLDDATGRDLIVRLARHVARFRLHDVEIDMLKLLYEALIDRAERHGLGEYYTPDWLAAKMVRRAIDMPLTQRVLDPACGSGTFLFHAVRHHLAAAAKANTDGRTRAETACALVAGMDIHPVAVIIARVTYLLALGEALTARRGNISIPVYVGDAMQLSVSSMLAGRELIIHVPGSGKGNRKQRRPSASAWHAGSLAHVAGCGGSADADPRRSSRTVKAEGSGSSRTSALLMARLGNRSPFSYFWNARGPPPIRLPACCWVRPSFLRMRRICSGSNRPSVRALSRLSIRSETFRSAPE